MSITAQEQEHIRVFGATLGPTYEVLHNQVTWLQAKWLEYRKLFGTTEARVAFLNGSAAFFFRVVQDVLLDDVLLGIARLTDPPGKGDRSTLTLQSLPDEIADPALAIGVRQRLGVIKTLVEPIRTMRNKRIAHCDRAIALGIGATPVRGVSRQEIEDALAGIRELINFVRHGYQLGEFRFELFKTTAGAESLLSQLSAASVFENQRTRRSEEGRQLPEDCDLVPEV